ncbi:MAG: VCBS domain-containing protein [Pirellulales bacterium]
MGINDVDEFDVGSVSDANATSNAVNENAANGTLVGLTASATDNDATTSTVTYTLTDSASGRFAIDLNTGVVTVADGTLLNREANASHTITVRATSADGSFTDQNFTIAINDVDEFDVGTVTDTNATTNAINENASIGTLVGITATASDSDSTNNTITYSLFDNDGGRFAIDANTGIVTVAGAINRETDGATRTITVRATSSDGSHTDQNFSIAINDIDEFDVGAVSDTNGSTNAVNENAANGTTVGITAAATDSDATTSTVTYTLTDSASGRFAIDLNTGVVTVADGSLLNREANASHTITVRATSADGSFTDQNFTIAINDVDEFDVGTVTDTNATANAIDENASIGTVVGITASAFDADATTNTITYSLFDNDGGRFAIDTNTGVVTLAMGLNRETDGATRTITVRASSSDGSHTDQNFTIAINDIDEFDVGTVSDSNGASNVVAEFAANGTTVGVTAFGVDSDATTNTISYTLDDSAGGRFAIHGSTGVVTVANGSLLDAAQSTSHTITVRATSLDGSSSTQTITITVANLNDAPTAVSDTAIATEAGGVANGTSGNNPTGNVLTNDTDPDVGDTHSVIGVNSGVQSSASGSVGSSVTGSYGSIVINADGSYTYTVNNSLSAVQALRTTSNTLADVFTYTQEDAGGLSSTTQITVTIQGQNDTPYDLTSGALTIQENASNGSSVGTITGLDVDAGDTQTYSLVDSAGGRFAINSSTGEITVADGSLLNFEANTNHNITVRVTDAAGTTYDEIFTIQLSDVNETPTSVGDTATAVEAGGVANGSAGTNPTGNVLSNDTDVDAGDTKAVSGVVAGTQASATGNVGSSVAGTYGSITLLSNGSYTYTVDNSNTTVQSLRTSADTLTDVFTYTMVDSGGLTSTTQITVTIEGQNDNPIAVADSALAIEAGGYGNAIAGTNPTGNVLANDTDVDAGDTKTITGIASGTQSSTSGSVGTTVNGSYGSITLQSNGSYTYSVDNSNATVQALRTSSDTITDVFSYTVTDAAGATSTTQITVTIQGRNDAPGAVDDTPTAVEAGGVNNGTAGTNPTGNLLSNDTDVDSGDTKTVIGVAAGSHANASGSVASTVSGSYGSITVNADGTYTYNVDNANSAVQALRTTSNTLQDIFTYTMEDASGLSSTATVTITIQGTNDAPVAVANSATAVEAGGVLNNISGSSPTGNVLTNDTDVDAGDTKTIIGVAFGNQSSASGNVGANVTGSYGSIVINANGTYTYTIDDNNATVEALNSGQSLSETFTYTVSDTAGATSTTTIVITIQGVDDLPFAIVDMDTAVEAGGFNNSAAGTNPSGNVLSNDIAPNGETVIGVVAGVAGSASGSVGNAIVGLFGSVVINSDGSYTYTVDNSNAAVQALRDSSDHLTDLFTYTMEDALGYQSTTQLTITLDGRNDTATAFDDTGIAVEAGGTANGSGGNAATGNVLSNDIDVDAGDTKAVIGVVLGTQSSASGNVGASVSGNFGSIVIHSDGTYTYTVNNNLAAVQALRTSADTLQELFTYTMEDTAGLTSTATVTITIQGNNDGPSAISDSSIAIEAGGTLNGTAGTNPSGNVLTNDTDVDSVANGETKSVVGVAAGVQASSAGLVGSSVLGSYGAITIQSDGSYSYVVDNSNATVQALRTTGDTLQDVFTYTMTDTAGSTSTTQITVTIQGANDAPQLTIDSADATEAGGYANATSGTNPTGNVLAGDCVVDAGDSRLVSGVAAGTQSSATGNVNTVVVGSYGSITIASNGTYTYNVDNTNASVQALRHYSDTLADTFTYTVTDAAGATTTTQIVITVHGQNDGPTAVADSATATEAGGLFNGNAGSNPSGNVLTNDTDLDSATYGETKAVVGVAAGVQSSTAGSVASSVTGSYGSIAIQSDGSYTYIVDNSNAAVQALRTSSQTLQDVFSYTMQDADGLSSTTQITITIQGQNDTPIGNNDIVDATEAGGVANTTAGVNPSGNVLSNDTDVDSGDSKSIVGVVAGSQASASGNVGTSVLGSYGSITIGINGSYTYTVDNTNSSVQALRTYADTLNETFTYSFVDAAGASQQHKSRSPFMEPMIRLFPPMIKDSRWKREVSRTRPAVAMPPEMS